jgi:hypothetical protein
MLKLVGQSLRGENPLHNDWSNMNEMDSAVALIKKKTISIFKQQLSSWKKSTMVA